MSLFGRREKRENTHLREDKERLLAKVDELKEELATARRDPGLTRQRETKMADRILTLEAENSAQRSTIRIKNDAIERLGKQLDDAIGVHAKPGEEGDLDAAGRREAERRAKAGGR
jgi:hypothetical protein